MIDWNYWCFVKDTNSEVYIKILNENLKEFKTSLENEWDVTLALQRDNAEIHVSKKSQKWKEESDIMCPPWPAQSPDISPIENLWKVLKANVQKRKIFPTSTEELKVALKEEWGRLRYSIQLGREHAKTC